MKQSAGFPVFLAVLLLLLVSVPYIVASVMSGPTNVFWGFLFNPIDGNTYLAKMYQGWRGEWKFTLPYSADAGEGAYLYTFYLFLGHVSKVLKLDLILVYHIARLLSVLLFIWTVWRFFRATIENRKRLVFTFALTFFGLGLGWILFPFSVLLSDFWIAEAYPFLSSFSNPHFPLSIALLLWLLIFEIEKQGFRWRYVVIPIISAVLASLSPFALALALSILFGLLVWDAAAYRRFEGVIDLFLVCLGGLPVAIYSFFAVQRDPVFAAWNAQNLTLTPPLWDLILAFSPALLLAIPGIFLVLRTKEKSARIFVVWFAITFVMVYLPLSLQRRFLIGFYIPVCGLSAYGLVELEGYFRKKIHGLSLILISLSLPSTLLILLVGQFGVFNHDPRLYLKDREVAVLQWLEANTAPDALILANPRMGLFIPARTGRRVIYGHPFETPNAEAELHGVEKFFTDAQTFPSSARKFLDDRQIDFVLFIPDEPDMVELGSIPGLEVVFNQDNVLVYRVIPP